MMHSALYIGSVSHRRRGPTAHRFTYRTRMLWLDLAELSQVFRDRWFWSANRANLAWFWRRDYLGDPLVPLDEAVRDCAQAAVGRRPAGPIRVLTQPRMLGLSFNPVTFYYCYGPGGESLEAVIAEITNTPWNERHCYVVPASGRGVVHARFGKRFHVSPFMPLDMEYEWTFALPCDELKIAMANHRGGQVVFDAQLHLKRREISGLALAGQLCSFSAFGVTQLARIYWQAAQLWLRRTPVYSHPS